MGTGIDPRVERWRRIRVVRLASAPALEDTRHGTEEFRDGCPKPTLSSERRGLDRLFVRSMPDLPRVGALEVSACTGLDGTGCLGQREADLATV